MVLRFQTPSERGFLELSTHEGLAAVDSGFYSMLWVKSGGHLNLTVDNINKSVAQDHILFITPDNRIENIEGRNIIRIAFNRNFYCIRDHDHEVSCNGFLFYGSAEIPILNLSAGEIQSFDLLLKVFLEEFENRDQIQGEMLQMLLKRWVIKCTRIAKSLMSEPQLPDERFETIRNFNVLVEKHFRQKHKVSEYAEMLFKSPKTITNYFALNKRKSPLEVINDRILLEAKRLLVYSDMSNKQIAIDLGYKNASHFSKFFKNGFDLSPKEFRNRHKQKE